MIANINPETGIAYGYISARNLHSELVDDLLFTSGEDLSYKEGLAEYLKEKEQEYEWELSEGVIQDEEFDEDFYTERFNNRYEADEPTIVGVKDGVHFRTSYMGGALHFWIFMSNVVFENGGRTSPCLPNAGLPDIPGGSVECYSVPNDWWSDEFIESQIEQIAPFENMAVQFDHVDTTPPQWWWEAAYDHSDAYPTEREMKIGYLVARRRLPNENA